MYGREWEREKNIACILAHFLFWFICNTIMVGDSSSYVVKHITLNLRFGWKNPVHLRCILLTQFHIYMLLPNTINNFEFRIKCSPEKKCPRFALISFEIQKYICNCLIISNANNFTVSFHFRYFICFPPFLLVQVLLNMRWHERY